MPARLLSDALLATLLTMAWPAAAFPACTAASGERRVPVLELYTSEGCDSCPPADRWVSQLAGRGLGHDRVVILGFHVDYWDYLGWKDPFAQRRFSDRQRALNVRNGSRVIYTPQLILNGKDYRRGLIRDDFAERVAAANQRPPGANITLRSHMSGSELSVIATVALARSTALSTQAQVFLALYENGLSSPVKAGENRGKHLRHDFVVRDLVGPFVAAAGQATEVGHMFPLANSWKVPSLGIAAYVQEPASGDILQAVALPACR
jgi:hypothetical protein